MRSTVMIIIRTMSVLATLFLLSGFSAATAQGHTEEVKSFLSDVQKSYKQSPYLSFRVKYQYSNIGGGNEATDSLSGEMQMDKGRCRMVLAGSEIVSTGRYVIQIMADDRSIFLSASRPNSSMDPVQLLDSMLSHINGVHGTVAMEGGTRVLNLEFPAGNLYSLIRMEIDPVTSLFRRISYKVHTELLVGRELVEEPGRPAPYKPEGEVTMKFSDYERNRFTDALFDEHNFFTRVSVGHFEPSERYRGYHIFLASNNL